MPPRKTPAATEPAQVNPPIPLERIEKIVFADRKGGLFKLDLRGRGVYILRPISKEAAHELNSQPG